MSIQPLRSAGPVPAASGSLADILERVLDKGVVITETPHGLRKHGAAFHARPDAVVVDFLLGERREGRRAKQLSVQFGEQGTIGM